MALLVFLIATFVVMFPPLPVTSRRSVGVSVTRVVIVDPTNGITNKTCWSDSLQPCRSLDLALQGAVDITDKISILLQPGDYNLTTTYDFIGKSGFELLVRDSQTVTSVDRAVPLSSVKTMLLDWGSSIRLVFTLRT